jgi:hypothetical protein
MSIELLSVKKTPFGVLAGANIKPFFHSHNPEMNLFLNYFFVSLENKTALTLTL